MAAILLLVVASFMNWSGILHADQWMPATEEAVFGRGELWRLWTTSWIHSDMGHLLSNSFLFFVLGYFLNGYFGWWVFPVTALVFGGLTNAAVLGTYPPDVTLLGASGIVYWLGGAWLTLYFLLNRQKSLFQRALRSLGVALVLFMPAEAFQPQISYRTHAAGFALGLLWGVLYFLWRKKEFRAAEVTEEILEDDENVESVAAIPDSLREFVSDPSGRRSQARSE
ncbi:MAG: rhomboid family intramembrane serine protease [Bdellovibrionaceae bacterium]|nr:rhomboid family intramembrane serine protease [Pseudobdellovibrionaceae bacterium]MBX3032868.1 rhomboid family intramembrane serine protease [Pseudobdellovibrionaceae bacterium]